MTDPRTYAAVFRAAADGIAAPAIVRASEAAERDIASRPDPDNPYWRDAYHSDEAIRRRAVESLPAEMRGQFLSFSGIATVFERMAEAEEATRTPPEGATEAQLGPETALPETS